MSLVRDREWAILTIYAEARSEGYAGMLAVACVIRNRMRLRYTSDGTVAGTVLQPKQFSCWNSTDPQRIRVAQASENDPAILAAAKAWEASLMEADGLVGKAVLYHGDYMRPYPGWSDAPGVTFVTQIGRHRFYTEE